MDLAPIVLFVYNRPKHTQKMVESLLGNNLAKDSLLIIYSDGPKNEGVRNDVVAVRNYLKTIIGFKEVMIVESENNVGLSKSIIKGVTETVNQYDKVVVLEDDLVVAPNFLNYMNAGLDKYQNDHQIMQISGYMYNVKLNIVDDALILPFVTGWGWGTWKRAWNLFSVMPRGYENLKGDKKMRFRFNLNDSYDYFGLLTSQVLGKIDTWGILWYLSVFINEGLAVHPTKTFVFNDGFDGSGTNCEPEGRPVQQPNFENTNLTFEFPNSLAVSEFENVIYKEMNKELNRGFTKRLTNKIKSLLR
ncbi:MAG: hypothetical protein A3J93_01075 [Candidatus Magasanikbacteria bacterium RIFOXYC2_FULL_42_28]|uniref:alpha-1,3-mannosyl-glycoprotein 2-beta-N-acetylglucosaminyltransferase n=1 Tax=Candidatus Magasanikbacteria bacterium RIFOXYC2_FULL_42_28 TaxID=1798704 RepID=A0A1F6NXR0_9BACT|nr:MAG: hypothetical protein A3J93_01075 [Candidatus Magasanikbacteria bacterium RIFOXYC2_FULL_42_28]